MSDLLPPNVHVSQHPCLVAKLSQLRSQSTPPRDVKALIHDITLIVGCEALAKALTTAPGPTVCFFFCSFLPASLAPCR